jgi:hypothetical protein
MSDEKGSDLEDLAGEIKDGLNLKVPLWGKILSFAVNFLPIPPWLKVLLPVVIGLIERLPHGEKQAAKAALMAAAKEAKRTGNADALVPVVKQYCSGMGCPPELK